MKTGNNRFVRTSVRSSLSALVFGALGMVQLSAGDYGKAVIDDKAPISSSPWTVCDVFEHNTLYEGDGFIKDIILHGRYHGQYIDQVEDIGGARNNGYHAYHHRRARFELEVNMAHDLKFAVDGNFADGNGARTGLVRDGGAFINDFQVFNIKWEPSDDFFIIIGKQKQNLTREDEESSKRIKTIERAAIVNEIAGARPWGAMVGFKTAGLSHAFGAWNYGAHGEAPQWMDTRANNGASYNLAMSVTDDIGVFFDYAFVDNNGGRERARGDAARGTFGSNYEHAFALGTEINKGRFNLIGDLIYAANRTRTVTIPAGSDTWGFYVLPSYKITDKLEGVFRYGYMESGGEQRTQAFGETGDGNRLARQSVENYHSFYAGFQYLLCGEHLKVLGGYEYTTGDLFRTNTDINTGSWQFGVRTYF